jgi:hypothetical protein
MFKHFGLLINLEQGLFPLLRRGGVDAPIKQMERYLRFGAAGARSASATARSLKK